MSDDLTTYVGFDVSSGVDAMNKLTKVFEEYNVKVGASIDVQKALNKEGKDTVLKIEAELDANMKLRVSMENVEGSWRNLSATIVRTSALNIEQHKAWDAILESNAKKLATVEANLKKILDLKRQLTTTGPLSLTIDTKPGTSLVPYTGGSGGVNRYGGSGSGGNGGFGGYLPNPYGFNPGDYQGSEGFYSGGPPSSGGSGGGRRGGGGSGGDKDDENKGSPDGASDLSAGNKGVLLSWQSMSRLLQIQLMHRAIATLTNALRDSVREATEFGIKITEIQTITTGAANSTAEWTNTIRGLSDTFGLPIIEAAAGSYEALSNQVTQSANDVTFLRDAAKLAVIGVGTFKQAIDALTGVINANNISVTEASHVSAILFETIKVGRVHLEEMGTILGRLNLISHQSGISIEEVSAAFATLTIQGIKADTASTLLQNVMLRLIKPGKETKEMFDEWGVSSFQAATETFGFVNVLKMMEEHVKKSKDPLSELALELRNIRAITGAQALFRTDITDKTLTVFSKADQDQLEAFNLSMESDAKKLQIEIEKLHNLFTVTYGSELIKDINSVASVFGGLTGGVQFLIHILEGGIVTWGIYKGGLSAVTLALEVYKVATTAATISTATFQAVATAGTSLLIFGAVEGLMWLSRASERAQEALEKVHQEVHQLAIENFDKERMELDAYYHQLEDVQTKQSQVFFEVLANINKVNIASIKETSAAMKGASKEMKLSFEETYATIEKNLTGARRLIEENQNQLQRGTERLQELQQAQNERIFTDQIKDKKPEEQIVARKNRATDDFAEANKLSISASVRNPGESDEQYLTRRQNQERQARQLFDEANNQLKKVEQLEDQHGKQLIKEDNKVAAEREEIAKKIANKEYQIAEDQKQRHTRQSQQRHNDDLNRLKEQQKKFEDAHPDVQKQNKDNSVEGIRRIEEQREIETEKTRHKNQQKQDQADKQHVKDLQSKAKDFHDEGTDLQKFKPDATSKDPFKEYDDLQKKMLANAKALGATELEIEDLKSKAMKDRMLLEKQLTEQLQSEKLANAKKDLEDAKTHQTEAMKRRAEAQQNVDDPDKGIPAQQAFITNFIDKLHPAIQEMNDALGLLKRGTQSPESTKQQETYEKYFAHINELNNLKEQAGKNPNDLNIQKQLVDKLNQVTQDIQQNNKQLKPQNFTEAQRAIVNVDGDAAKFSKLTQGILDEQKKFDNANKELGDINRTLQFANDTIAMLPKDLQVLTKDILEGTRQQVTVQMQMHDALLAILKVANAQWLAGSTNGNRAAFEPQSTVDADNKAAGGYVNYLAKGGFPGGPSGSDRYPAYLSRGEYVWDAMTTRQWLPVIQGMHQSSQRGASNNITNVGDIHVNVNGGSTSQATIREIANGIRRMSRQGLFN